MIPPSIFGQSSDDNISKDAKLDVVGYSPYRENQGPRLAQPSVEDIKEDLEILKKITDEIRLYGMTGSTEKRF